MVQQVPVLLKVVPDLVQQVVVALVQPRVVVLARVQPEVAVLVQAVLPRVAEPQEVRTREA